MDAALVDNIHAQLEVSSQPGSPLDLSLVGIGKDFKRLKTYIATIFIILLTISQTTVAVLVLVGVIDFHIAITPIKSEHFLPFHFLLVLQSFCWLSTILLDRRIHCQSTKHKKHGYVSFYASSKFIRRLPGYIMSSGCAASLIVAGLWGDTSPPWHKVTPQIFMVVVAGLQTMLILPASLYYIGVVVNFNTSGLLPDMERYLKESDTPIQIQIGTSRSQEELEITIDKQAEIIQSLQHHNQVLARRIMSLHKQIKA